jgi:transposase-like protein
LPWRIEQKEGFPQRKLGRKPTEGPKAKEIARLERENRRLAEQLRKAGIIIEAQKKLCDALGLEVPPIPED